jgi:hypothetical protein
MIGTKDASGPQATPQRAAVSMHRKPLEVATRAVHHLWDVEPLNPLNLLLSESGHGHIGYQKKHKLAKILG